MVISGYGILGTGVCAELQIPNVSAKVGGDIGASAPRQPLILIPPPHP